MVEHSAVNRRVVGSSPTRGACAKARTIPYGMRGPLVKRLRHRPFTAVTWVQIPQGSLKEIYLDTRTLSSVGQSSRLITDRSWVRVPEGPFKLEMNNKAQWLSWLERRPVTAEAVGSSPIWVVRGREICPVPVFQGQILICPSGGIGRRLGLKIPCRVIDVPVRPRPGAFYNILDCACSAKVRNL